MADPDRQLLRWLVRHGITGAIISLVVAFIFCVVTFGAFFVLIDIQSSVHAIKNKS